MTDYKRLPLADATLGQEVTVWNLENDHYTWGQGGKITALTPDLVITASGVDHPFPRDKFDHDMCIEVAVPTDPSECVNYGPDCRGEVEYFDPSGRGRPFPRCESHREERARSYANSIEKYAHCVNPPSWFDPTYAGESWNGD